MDDWKKAKKIFADAIKVTPGERQENFKASAATRSPLAVTPWQKPSERQKREPCLTNYQNYQPGVTFRHTTLR
ncbi:MAG: hypothetical protein ACR2HT_05125 [Pyrinomonadaceae bacterium]